mmetsp:Transcript_32642/g.77297  ORF Transcript_32642/g.77297 Transcript_32642/m.77297 type:complete len:222 (-) Transcript_32642:232-897(-)
MGPLREWRIGPPREVGIGPPREAREAREREHRWCQGCRMRRRSRTRRRCPSQARRCSRMRRWCRAGRCPRGRYQTRGFPRKEGRQGWGLAPGANSRWRMRARSVPRACPLSQGGLLQWGHAVRSQRDPSQAFFERSALWRLACASRSGSCSRLGMRSRAKPSSPHRTAPSRSSSSSPPPSSKSPQRLPKWLQSPKLKRLKRSKRLKFPKWLKRFQCYKWLQ